MTHSIDAPLPPPTTTGTGAYAPTTTGTTTGSPSTTDVAKDEAKNVKDTAAQAGTQVASTAADQAKEVAAETQRQAKDLLDQGRAQLKDQAITQQQKAASGLTSLADELRGLANGTSTGAPGPARDLLQQGAGMVESFASKLQNREPAELLDEIRSFARRKPGMFLLGAAAAGIVAGRLTRGVQAAHSDTSGSGSRSGQTNYVDPMPTYSDTTATTGYVAGGVAGSEFSTAGAGYASTGAATPLPPPPYGTVPPAGSVVPPATPTSWDDPSRRPGGVG
jgi:hypothetical protein